MNSELIGFNWIVRCAAIASVAFSLVLVPAEPAHADTKDFLKGAAIGAAIGAIVNNNRNKSQNTATSTSRKPKVATKQVRKLPVVRDDANVQRALNYLGFDAGPADGLFGSRTKTAIRGFQGAAKQPVTGTLTSDQRAFLLAKYAQRTSAQPPRNDAATTNTGANVTAAATTTDTSSQSPNTVAKKPAAPAAQTSSKPVTNKGAARILAALSSEPATAGLAVPNIGDKPDTNASSDLPLAEQLCAIIDSRGLESLNFGAVDEIGGSVEVLGNSYCTARAWALTNVDAVIDQIPDFDAETVQAQCDGFLPQHKDAIFESLQQPAPVATGMMTAILGNPDASQAEQYGSFFSVCYGLSEALGNYDSSLAYASLKVGAGFSAYGELVGAQIALGLGASQDVEVASTWFATTATALDDGAEPLVIPFGDYDHSPLLRAVAELSSGLTETAQELVKRSGSASGGVAGKLLVPVLITPKENVQQLLDSAVARKALGQSFDLIYGMPQSEALDLCVNDPDASAAIGLSTCRALALAAKEWDHANAFTPKIESALAK